NVLIKNSIFHLNIQKEKDMTEASAKKGGPFSKAWQNSDAVLVVEEKELHVHSMILSLASPYFDKMFNGSFKESQTKRVTLEGKSFELIEQMLKIIYPNFGCEIGGELENKLQNLKELAQLSDEYNVSAITRKIFQEALTMSKLSFDEWTSENVWHY
uniref:BTB domain-containing protein n=1 Tax=Clytia hemisphaerica TaxID=252671 RepID=A0A7M5VDI8_9CNID